MKCQHCGTKIQESSKFCSKCGSKLEQPPVVKTPASNSFLHDISNIWPEWQFEKQLGRGSYGVVYQAVRRDNNVESHAAIKIISIPSDSSEVDSLRSEGLDMDGTRTYFKGIVDDFVGEIQLMESLKGIQNIVSVEDYKVVEKKDSIGWDIYIRMELLTPFNSYICDKTLTEKEIIKLGSDICNALEICGQRNIIHRDIKPENIFINDFGHFKLGDFGIARKLENMTGGLSQKGTFNYMAPEVANSNEYDARVDTYSLGIVLYRLLNNNKLPFLDTDKHLLNPNERKQAVERRIRGEALPAPCNASSSMANLILRACAHNPNARFTSATAMKEALSSVANGTYVIMDTNLDKTTSFRSAQTNYDATTSVRKAKTNSESTKPSVESFGDKPIKKKKGKKAKIIAISILSGIVALAIFIAMLFFTGAPYSIYKDMQEQKYSSAASEYRREVEDSFFNRLILKALLDGEPNKAIENYNSGEWDYYEAKAHLDALLKMEFDEASDKINELSETYANSIVQKFNDGDLNFEEAKDELNDLVESGYDNANDKINSFKELYANSIANKYKNGDLTFAEATNTLNGLKADGCTKADELIAEITAVENSNTALDKGNEYYKNGDYEAAIEELSKIPEGSENYEEAQEKLNQAYASYIDSTAETIKKYNTQKKYKEAVQYANIAYDVLPDSVDTTKIDTAKEDALTAYKTEIANRVTSLINDEDYVEAFDVIDEAISFDDNEYFQNLKVTTKEKYVDSISATVRQYLDNDDFVNAKKVADNALKVLPDNEDLKELVRTVEDTTPKYLLDVCEPYITSYYAKYPSDDQYSFSMGGSSYTNGFTLNARYSDPNNACAIFNTNGDYTNLSFLVGHVDGTELHDITLRIFCDNMLVYEIVVNRESLPQKVSIDITDVNQIKIATTRAGGGYTSGSTYGFANVIVE